MNLFTAVQQNTQTQNTPAKVTRQSSRGEDPVWNTGDVISATLIEKNNEGFTLRSGDTIFTATSGVQGEVGDNLMFEVVKNGKKGMTLRQIETPAGEPRRVRGNANLADEIKEHTGTLTKIGEEDQRRNEAYQEEQQKAARAVAAIQRAQSFLSANASKSAAAALVESGLSLDKIGFTSLSRVMREADKRPAEESPKGSKDEAAPASALHRHGAAVNEKNIQTLEKAWEKISTPADDRTVARLIGDEAALTPENVYISRYSTPTRNAPAQTEAPDWEAMTEEVKKHFAREGITDTEVNREAARFLWENGLPLERANIEKTVFMRQMAKQVTQADFYEKAAESITSDAEVMQIPMTEIAGADKTRRTKETETATRVRRTEAFMKSNPVSEPENKALRRVLTDRPDVRWDERITARRALAEIQLKFTTEAASRLNNQELTIETEPLREALSFLTRRENEEYARFLRMAGTNDGAEPVSRMNTLFNTLAEIKPLTVNVHADLLLNRVEYSLSGVHDSVLAARARETQDAYDTFATVPSARHGDRFAKVRDQFAPLLTEMGISDTRENMKAAFILSKNNMDVNWENITAVKEIDTKINAITHNLHPMIAAQMIKDGLQPLDMQLDQVLAYIKQFKQTLGEDGGDKIARYIMEMDENQSIDADTRKSMIAVYRMLHVIQKDGAASLGLAAKKDGAVTLGGLLGLSKKKPLDVAVDDAFGALERLKRPEASIRGILEAIPRKPVTHADLVTDAFIDLAEPDYLHALLNEVPGGTELPLEDLPDSPELTGQTASPAQPSAAVMAQMQAFIAASPGLVAYLENRNIPATAGSLRALEKLSRASALSEAINDWEASGDETAEALASVIPETALRALKEGQTPEQLFAKALARLDTALAEAGSAGALERVSNLRDLVGLRGALNEDGGFQIPVRLNGRVSTLSLYVLNESAMFSDGAKILLSLDTENLGTVQSYFTLNDGTMDVLVTADDPRALARLEDGRELLNNYLAEAGINRGTIRFTQNTPPQPVREDQPARESVPARTWSEHEYEV